MVSANTPDLTDGKLVFFTTIEKAKISPTSAACDLVKLHVVKNANKGPCGNLQEKRFIDGKVVAEADFGAMIVDPDR